MQVQPYLFFEGRCEEALEFYAKALGAKVGTVMRYSDSPMPAPEGKLPAGSENKVMHASFTIGQTTLMASDGLCSGKPGFQGFALTLEADDVQQAQRWFTALSEGGKIQMPLAETFFSPQFGMVFDRFGLLWMVTVA